MDFFTSGFFWFIEGILTCLMIIGFKLWIEDKKINMPYWKWILFGVWVLLFAFTIAFVGTSLGENEPHAAFNGAVIFGLVTIVSGVGLWRILLIKK